MSGVRRSLCVILMAVAVLQPAAAAGAAAAHTPNRLANHPSAYLALHGDDPVDWRPWGEEALALARESNRPLFISSGYFACHWCHVMQQESFKDPAIAALINTRFVPVKVDRELLPALDDWLIGFVKRTRGVAGWPLNAFLSPAGHPLVGFAYLPAEEFRGFLERLAGRWEREHEALAEVAARAVAELAGPARAPRNLAEVELQIIEDGLLRQTRELADPLAGGFGEVSKFPASPQLLALLEMQARQPRADLARTLELTLEQMAREGLRDHLGGGFFRYTTDPAWQVPHFEKMLYDNALLALVYLRAAEVLGRPGYRQVARQTLDFLLREMRTPEGAFISSLSAIDDAGIEGGYYLWTEGALGAALSPRALAVARRAWRLEGAGLEGGFLPMAGAEPQRIARELGLSGAEVDTLLDEARVRLLAARSGRTLPRDNKALAGWNGLVLRALAEASGLPDGEPFRAAGGALRDYLLRVTEGGQRVQRALMDGEPVGEASLEDYAYLAAGLSAWARLQDDPAARAAAAALLREAWSRFRREHGWQLAETPLIPFGPPETALADGPMPSPSALVLRVSLELAETAPELAEMARAVVRLEATAMRDAPFSYASHVILLRSTADSGPIPPSGGP